MSIDNIDQETSELPTDTILWRYMSFESFTSLLVKRTFWFNRIDKFRDKTEGLYPPNYYSVDFLASEYERAFPDNQWKPGFGPEWQAQQAVYRHKMATRYRVRWAVNSWRKGKKDSEAMWATYSRLDSGIAIVTDLGRLRNAFADPKWRVGIKGVHYLDRDSLALGEYPEPFLCKDESFHYEEEVRAFVDLLQDKKDPPILEFRVDLERPSDDIKSPGKSALAKLKDICGTDVKVSPSLLIERVVLAPKTPFWVVGLVRELLDNAKVNCECPRSTLYDYPFEVGKPEFTT
jgi:hypothetical protein